MPYSKIKSKFIREKLKGLKWSEKNREYINDLMIIEDNILGKPNEFFSNVLVMGAMIGQHKKEFLEIAKELRPNDFEQFIKQTEKEAEEAIVKFRNKTKELQEEEKRLIEEMKKEWEAAGGVV